MKHEPGSFERPESSSLADVPHRFGELQEQASSFSLDNLVQETRGRLSVTTLEARNTLESHRDEFKDLEERSQQITALVREKILKAIRYARETAANIPRDAVNVAKSTAEGVLQTVTHPLDTLAAMDKLGMGIAEKVIIPGKQPDEVVVDAIVDGYKGKYGSVDAASHTLREHPVETALDVAGILSAAGTIRKGIKKPFEGLTKNPHSESVGGTHEESDVTLSEDASRVIGLSENESTPLNTENQMPQKELVLDSAQTSNQQGLREFTKRYGPFERDQLAHKIRALRLHHQAGNRPEPSWDAVRTLKMREADLEDVQKQIEKLGIEIDENRRKVQERKNTVWSSIQSCFSSESQHLEQEITTGQAKKNRP